MHVPSGLFVYGLYQKEENNGTQFVTPTFNKNFTKLTNVNSDGNETDVWYVKAGIKKAWMPAGATVLFGEWAQYNDMFAGLCGLPGNSDDPVTTSNATACIVNLPIGVVGGNGRTRGDLVTATAALTGSEVDRWGIGVVQEIDSAAMHVFARWQHLDLDIGATDLRLTKVDKNGLTVLNNGFGKSLSSSFEGLDLFQIGGVIFF